MRVLIDYRPALRSRSGVGEYTHQLAAALLERAETSPGAAGLELTLFSSSWKDRFTPARELARAATVDLRIPVTALNAAWHRLGWPPAETLTGHALDVCHSMHPLLMPARRAAQVITIYDLDFLVHPERTRREIRRDYPALVRAHASRADHVIVISRFTASEVERQLGVPPERISICYPGAPEWRPRAAPPADGYLLFFGTLEPRKNIGTLLDAYAQLLERADGGRERVPELVLAGGASPDASGWLERIARPPLAGRVRHLGYVSPDRRREVYDGARALVQPSFNEGFGMPVVEAMAAGVPVVAADRGALPEVVGDAGVLVNPEDPASLANGLDRMLRESGLAETCADRGVARAQRFRWTEAAQGVYEAYRQAIARRVQRRSA